MNAIAAYIGLKRRKELLVLHSFQVVIIPQDSFYVGKVKFWDAWIKNLLSSKTFLLYRNCPTLPLAEEKLKVIESFVVSLFVTELDISSSVNIARYQIFKYRVNSEMRLLAPTRDAFSNIFIKPQMYLVISGKHCTYRQER